MYILNYVFKYTCISSIYLIILYIIATVLIIDYVIN